MKIYIDGEKLMESFYDTPKSKRSWSRAWWLINHAKLSDVRENVRGEWILHIDDLFPAESTMECNQCHKHQPITIDDNFCPNCGAKMSREESDNG